MDEGTRGLLQIRIVSDGSTDSTAETVRGLALGDSRIELIELHKNIGPGLARDLAIRGGFAEGKEISAAAGEYIALLDDDDFWINPAKLSNQLAFMSTHGDVVLVGAARVEFVREDGRHIMWLSNRTRSEDIRRTILGYNPVITSSSFFRKSAYLTAGGFSPMYLSEDYDLWLRLGQVGKIANIPGAETQYTIRDAGAAKSNRIAMHVATLALIKKYKRAYPNYGYALLKAYARIILFKIHQKFPSIVPRSLRRLIS